MLALNENKLTVSVAIPTYNREQVLIDTIEQVLAQNPPADEVTCHRSDRRTRA